MAAAAVKACCCCCCIVAAAIMLAGLRGVLDPFCDDEFGGAPFWFGDDNDDGLLGLPFGGCPGDCMRFLMICCC